jgi:hypothetical protein
MENEITVNLVRGRITFDSPYVIVIKKDREREMCLSIPNYDRFTLLGRNNEQETQDTICE